MIYLIADESLKFCKIGYSKNPEKRLVMLQTGCPMKLHIKARRPGDIPAEREIQKRLAQWRIRGEWFEYSEELEFEFEDYLPPCDIHPSCNIRHVLKGTLQDMMETTDIESVDYETWADNILYMIRDQADEFADEADQATAYRDPDKPNNWRDRDPVIVWKAIIDMALYGKWN